ncbi:amidohydrolase [Amycolatopsis sp. NPDC004079]|uniref:amidohydrolase n=1 Tax=Amycolatopsis sp. NPDC004079 TaxID=3154549 RepID=UPI0033A0160B
MSAELILTNATVYTVAAEKPWAAEVAVADGLVLAVGDDVAEHRGKDTEVRDLGGAFVMPGLVDVHNHHSRAGQAELFELSLSADLGFAQVLTAVRERAAELTPGEWVIGHGWGSTLVEAVSRESARRALDAAAADRPVLLADDSGHNRWANTAALRVAGIDRDTPDPDGGIIVRDRATGEPSGLLLEAAGQSVERIARAAQGLTEHQHVSASRRAIEILHSHGITAFQDAAVSTDILSSLHALDTAGELSAWVVTSMLINDQIFGFDLTGEALIAVGEQYRSQHHRPDFVKIFLDGVPPTRTAAFLEPYLPDEVHGACHRGGTAMSPGELVHWLHLAAAAGLGAKIHCAGDASVRAALDAIEIVRQEGNWNAKFQIAHGQFVHPDDVPRFAALAIAADISPFIWVPGVIPAAIAAVLPAGFSSRLHPNRSLLDAGALIAGGSDWPVSPSPHAWDGIQGLVTRRDPTQQRPGALWEEQAITLQEAIAVFTLNGAKAMGVDDVTGSLTPGKSADFVVLDQNPFDVPAASLAETRAVETWFAGRPVYTAE